MNIQKFDASDFEGKSLLIEINDKKVLIDPNKERIKYLTKGCLTIIDTKNNKIRHLIDKNKIKASNN